MIKVLKKLWKFCVGDAGEKSAPETRPVRENAGEGSEPVPHSEALETLRRAQHANMKKNNPAATPAAPAVKFSAPLPPLSIRDLVQKLPPAQFCAIANQVLEFEAARSRHGGSLPYAGGRLVPWTGTTANDGQAASLDDGSALRARVRELIRQTGSAHKARTLLANELEEEKLRRQPELRVPAPALYLPPEPPADIMEKLEHIKRLETTLMRAETRDPELIVGSKTDDRGDKEWGPRATLHLIHEYEKVGRPIAPEVVESEQRKSDNYRNWRAGIRTFFRNAAAAKEARSARTVQPAAKPQEQTVIPDILAYTA